MYHMFGISCPFVICAVLSNGRLVVFSVLFHVHG